MNRFLTLIVSACLFSGISLTAQESPVEITFNFHEPSTLTPSVPELPQKGAYDLDGKSFSEGPVEVSFTASEDGNTHVRLYNSYDAGIDLRVYDGESLTIACTDPAYRLLSAEFTVSLSGGQADCDFYPSAGEYVWVDNTWLAGDDERVSEVELTSILQSRMTMLVVRVAAELTSGNALAVAANEQTVRYADLAGRLYDSLPATAGIYLRISADGAERVVVR